MAGARVLNAKTPPAESIPAAASGDPRSALWASADPTVDDALCCALRTAQVSERPQLARVMLEREHLASLVALVETQDVAGEAERGWVLEAARERLDGAIRVLMTRATGPGAKHALRLIREARLGRLGYLLTELIRRGRGGLAEEAVAVLVELCEQPDADSADALRSAVDAAVARFDRHGHPGVLEAYLRLLPAPMPAALGALQTPGHAAVAALGERLAAAKTRTDRRALLALASAEPLHEAIRAGLRRCRSAEAWTDVLAEGHLLTESTVQNMLQEAGTSAENFDWSSETIQGVGPEARRWLPVFWSKLPMPAAVQLRLQAGLAEDPDTSTRLSALRAIAELPNKRIGEGPDNSRAVALVKFAHDPDRVLARLAAATLDRDAAESQRRSSMLSGEAARASANHDVDHRTLARMATSPHPTVRATAGLRLGPTAFARIWSQWDRLDRTRRVASLQALRKLDPRFDDRLLGKIRETDATSAGRSMEPKALSTPIRLRALAWIRALACPPGVLTETAVKLTADADPKVVASAAMALGMTQDASVATLLLSLTQHADGRVRANAVEALDQRVATHGAAAEPTPDLSDDRLANLIRDDTPRVRANALLAMFRREGRDALPPLVEMLRDARPEHRRSAIWLAGVTGVVDVMQADGESASVTQLESSLQFHDEQHASTEAIDPPAVAELLRALEDELDVDAANGAAA